MKGRFAQLPHADSQLAPSARPAGDPPPGPAIPMVQCSPFQPGLHSHLPSRHVPCSAQRGWQARWSQAAPIQPSSQRQVPPTQTPWPPQSAAQISVGRRRKEWGKGAGGGGEENKTHLEPVTVGTKSHPWLPTPSPMRRGSQISLNNDPRMRTILQAKACPEPVFLPKQGRLEGSALFVFPYCQPVPASVPATSKGDRPSEQM